MAAASSTSATPPARHDVILDFWFGTDREKITPNFDLWYGGTPAIDKEITEKFLPDVEAAIQGKQAAEQGWLDDKHKLLALIILLDQFSLNVYRDQPKGYHTTALAVPITYHAIEKGYHKELPFMMASFVYHPLMHSETLADQDKSVELYSAHIPTEGEGVTEYALIHRDAVAKYGRFPGRNEVMGRTSTEAELQYFKEGGIF